MNTFEMTDDVIVADVRPAEKKSIAANAFNHSFFQRMFAGNRFYILTELILFIMLDAVAWLQAFAHSS